MDELLAALVKVHENLDEFDSIVCNTQEALQSEVDLMTKEVLLKKDAESISKDIDALEQFHSTMAAQMREYLEQKINTLKAYLYDE